MLSQLARLVCLAVAILVIVWPEGGVAPSRPAVAKDAPSLKAASPRQAEIDAAIDRARQYILKQLEKDFNAPEVDVVSRHYNSIGYQWLMTAALLKIGERPDHPEILKRLESIKDACKSGTYKPADQKIQIYESSVALICLVAGDPARYRNEVSIIANFIISKQLPEGCWDYSDASIGDTSISQFAVLALWDATRAGVDVPRTVWNNAASWFVKTQLRDGGFAYHPLASPLVFGTHSMSMAGLGSLHICRMFLYPGRGSSVAPEPEKSRKKKTIIGGRKYGVLEPYDPDSGVEAAKVVAAKAAPVKSLATVGLTEIDDAIRKGFKWFEDNFTVRSTTSPYPVYYLYGMERLAAFSNRRTFAGHDWYEAGAAELIETQTSEGAWNDSSGVPAGAAFGAMFLVRATAKAMNRIKSDPRLGGGLLLGGRGLPKDLKEVSVANGGVQVRKSQGATDDLLTYLENPVLASDPAPASNEVADAVVESPDKLVGKVEPLLKLVDHPRADVRRSALWALGRSRDVRGAKALIAALSDPDADCVDEARLALRYLSQRRLADITTGETLLPPMTPEELADWKAWFLSVRTYDERDDFQDPPRKKGS
jgi:hypothetical protein